MAKQWYVYLIAKIVAGFAAGFIGTSVMTYISEITMPKMRGSHLSAFALFFAIGQVASAVGLEVLQNVSHVVRVHPRATQPPHAAQATCSRAVAPG